MKINKKQASRGTRIAALALAGVAVVAGASAYLTDSETATNKFVVGDIKVDLEEPKYPGNDDPGVKDIHPNDEINKDPQVENTGEADAVVFLKVTVPRRELEVAADDGTKSEKALQEIFIMKDEDDSIASHEHNFDEKWINLEKLGSQTDDDKTYVFGYSEILKSGEKTNNLFDKVQLVNAVEGWIDNSAQDIKIDVYAIQEDNLIADGELIDTSTLNDVNLEAIYNIYFNQNKDNIKNDKIKDADTNNKKDLKGDDLAAAPEAPEETQDPKQVQ